MRQCGRGRMVEELVAVQHDTPAPEPVSAKPVDAPKAAEKPKAPEEPAAEPQEAATEEKPTVAEQETQPEGVVKQEKKATHGVGVAPRDASERLVFATWAGLTGARPPASPRNCRTSPAMLPKKLPNV